MSLKTIALNRMREMARLYRRYCPEVLQQQYWVLPYVWDVHYVAAAGSYTEEFICYTNDIAFASMAFTGWALKEKKLQVTITGMQLISMENEFEKILQS